MAIIHKATLAPGKQELMTAWLDDQPWGGAGEVELLGSYRFDDPDGEVGVEALVVRRGEGLLHVVLTYRGAPLEGADAHLVGTTEHSVLGRRWVYDGAGDPVALGCFSRTLHGEQQQAVMEVWEDGRLLGRRDASVQVSCDAGAGQRVELARVLDSSAPAGAARLLASWDGGSADVAWLA